MKGHNDFSAIADVEIEESGYIYWLKIPIYRVDSR